MTDISSALRQAQAQLAQTHAEVLWEAELLLCHLLHKNRAYLYAHGEEQLEATVAHAFDKLINQRCQGIPIAYLTGLREFWSLPLKVNAHTLIPRHETERIVELALELIPDKPHTEILDLGTGSGAIALALAQERPHWLLYACDNSLEALSIAQENAHNLSINNVSFYHSYWFDQIPQKSYQAILSNPPYIALDDPHLKQGDLRFEPQTALASGQNGLADLHYIIEHSMNYLLPGGLLLLEHGYDQKKPISTILKQLAYENVHCWQDLLGHDRVSGGWRTI